MPPRIPPQNGVAVTTRTFSYKDMVLREWGPEFNKPDTAYVFSNGRKFDSTDMQTTGIYKRR